MHPHLDNSTTTATITTTSKKSNEDLFNNENFKPVSAAATASLNSGLGELNLIGGEDLSKNMGKTGSGGIVDKNSILALYSTAPATATSNSVNLLHLVSAGPTNTNHSVNKSPQSQFSNNLVNFGSVNNVAPATNQMFASAFQMNNSQSLFNMASTSQQMTPSTVGQQPFQHKAFNPFNLV